MLKERIERCKTAVELNSLRILCVTTEGENFTENQRAFIKKKNHLKRIPHRRRGRNFGRVYDPGVEQEKE